MSEKPTIDQLLKINASRKERERLGVVVTEALSSGDWESSDNAAFVITREAYLALCKTFGIQSKKERVGF